MTADEFASRVNGKRSGKGFMARCPAHEDKTASLSIADGDDGGVIVKCHAGCSFEAICEAAGIDMLDLAPERAASDREIVTTYDYVDEEGTLLFQAVRFRPKGFSQRRPIESLPGKQDWLWNLKGVKRIPYRLPELLQSVVDGRSVWIVEGEKDVDALRGLGFVATCNPMGAEKWAAEFSDYLKGAPWVLVVPDCDQPGRDHAHQVAATLTERNIPVKVIDLGRSDGYDVYDFIVEHGDDAGNKLRELARKTERWTRTVRPPLPIQSVSTFLANVPKYDEGRDYLGSLLHGGYRVHLAGPIGHGKTSFLLEAVSAAVRGDDFLGFGGRGGLRCLYVDLEMPAELLAQAIRDARLDRNSGFQLMNLPDGLRIDTHPEDRELLERAAEGFDLLVIDPFYKLMEQEMEYSATRTINACLDGIRARHPNLCTLIGFHAQEPQTPRERMSMSSISGFKVFQRPADIALILQRIEGDTSRVTWVKNRSPRLPVRLSEHWTLEWERGRGFTRVQEATLRDTEDEFEGLFA